MPKRLLGLLLLAVLAGVVPAPGAQAGQVGWADAEDDAVFSDPIPSEPSLDILRVNASSDATKLIWTAAIKKLAAGAPPASTGYSFRFHFVHNDVGYFFDVIESAVLGSGVYFAPEEATDPTISLECNGCSGKIDRTKNLVSLSVPFTTLTAGFRQTDASSPKAGPGTVLTELLVDSWRDAGLLVLNADDAPAPENTELRL